MPSLSTLVAEIILRMKRCSRSVGCHATKSTVQNLDVQNLDVQNLVQNLDVRCQGYLTWPSTREQNISNSKREKKESGQD